MMSLDEIKELNNKWQKDKNIAYEYNGTELQTLNGEHIGVDLMLSDEGLELQVCKVIGFNNQNEKMWETFALESIDIDKINSDNELENYLQERIDEYENEIKNDIDEEGFVINRELANKIGGLEYKGIYIQYLYDTNTMLFTIDNEYKSFNDSDDIDCIIYRNETIDEIKKYVDNLVNNLIKEKKVKKIYHLKNTYNDHDEYTTDENKIIMIYIDEMAQCVDNHLTTNNFGDYEYKNATGWLYEIMKTCGKYNRNQINIDEIINNLNKEHNWCIETCIKKESEK